MIDLVQSATILLLVFTNAFHTERIFRLRKEKASHLELDVLVSWIKELDTKVNKSAR